MSGRRIIFAVYDDLFREYRGYKTALSFKKAGYNVKLIGVKFGKNKLEGWESIPHRRISLFKKAPLVINMFIFWLKLFFMLMKEKSDVIYSHDIFPLFPVFLVSRIKGVPFIYDAHEFWRGNSQIEHRPAAKKFWTVYEKIFIKKAKSVITVSSPIAAELEKIYNIKKVTVITNLPLEKEIPRDRTLIHKLLGLEKDKKIVMYQGGFLFNNGLEDSIKAFVSVDRSAVLVLVGGGSEKESLINLVKELNLSDRVFFIGPFPHGELIKYTVCADIGLCLIKNSGKSYYYSAPNKMFEFIQAGVPQIASDFPEMIKYVHDMNTGINIEPSDIELIALTINKMLSDSALYNSFKASCLNTARDLLWEKTEFDLTDTAQ